MLDESTKTAIIDWVNAGGHIFIHSPGSGEDPLWQLLRNYSVEWIYNSGIILTG